MSTPDSTNINYCDTYIQHVILTKILGDPMYHSIATLETEYKVGAISVRSTLCGGNSGLLGLFSTPAAYAYIFPNTPFTRPELPVQFNPTITATSVAVATTKYN